MSGHPLSVLQVASGDRIGGAEKVASDLHAEFLRRGIDSWTAVGCKTGDDPRVVEIPNEAERNAWSRTVGGFAQRLAGSSRVGRVAAAALKLTADPVRYVGLAAGREDFSFPRTARLLELIGPPPDVCLYHNLHGYYFDLRELPRLTENVPGILTMHDAWLLTGHCAHPFECPGWRTGCGNCPDLDLLLPIKRDASAKNREVKRDILSRSRIGIATPSQWLMRMVEEVDLPSGPFGRRVIPNGVDVTVFRPGDRQEARRALGLPIDREILMFAGRVLTTSVFKDFATLERALPHAARERGTTPILLAVGDPDAGTHRIDGVEVIGVPFVDNPETMANYYRAADVYAHPARAENFPLAPLEAMACGTPVVATDVGGVAEIVDDHRTGLLVPPADADALAAAIAVLLGNAEMRSSYRAAGVERVRARFTLSRQAGAYLEWFEECRAAARH